MSVFACSPSAKKEEKSLKGKDFMSVFTAFPSAKTNKQTNKQIKHTHHSLRGKGLI